LRLKRKVAQLFWGGALIIWPLFTRERLVLQKNGKDGKSCLMGSFIGAENFTKIPLTVFKKMTKMVISKANG